MNVLYKNSPMNVLLQKQPHERVLQKQPHERVLQKQPHERALQKQPHERVLQKQPHERALQKTAPMNVFYKNSPMNVFYENSPVILTLLLCHGLPRNLWAVKTPWFSPVLPGSPAWPLVPDARSPSRPRLCSDTPQSAPRPARASQTAAAEEPLPNERRVGK